MIRIHITPRRIVDCQAVLPIPLSANKVWGQLRDFHTFARQEFFHANIDVEGKLPRQGASIQITHRFFLFRVRRVGRICRWSEGVGYAFSDLSARNPQFGFPHIFSYRIHPLSPITCNIEIRVSGKWTSTLLPRWLVWLWLRWIMQFAVQHVENELLIYQLWLATRKFISSPSNI
jgi:hypothetical protein